MTKLQEILRNRVRAHQMHHCIMSYYDDHCVKLNEDAADALDAAEAEIARLKEELLRAKFYNSAPSEQQIRQQRDEWPDCQLPAVAEDVVERIKQLLGKYPGEMRVREESDSEHRMSRYFVDYLGTNEPVVLEIAGYLEKDMARLIAALFNYAAANLLRTDKEPV